MLAFHGVGGIGKTWLLHRLRQIALEEDRQTAYINLDRTLQGGAYLNDPNYALFALREQIGGDTPRFDLAYAIFRYKRVGTATGQS
ncbi:MAG: hypothetical protein JNN08_15725 [Bryobacterales bacterium]|nr:hypothetical protein [Bryobacterales bacterium]